VKSDGNINFNRETHPVIIVENSEDARILSTALEQIIPKKKIPEIEAPSRLVFPFSVIAVDGLIKMDSMARNAYDTVVAREGSVEKHAVNALHELGLGVWQSDKEAYVSVLGWERP
jgi:hypothetical protein